MGARLLKALSFPLGARLLIPLFLIVAAGLSIHAFRSFRSTRQHLMRAVAVSSAPVMRTTLDSLIRNEPGCRKSGCHTTVSAPLDHAFAAARRQLVFTTLLITAVVGLAVALIAKTMARSQTLEEKVAEELAALQEAQRQVLHMEKMASLGKLSATVAHELNNPISGMLTYARLIERELYDQPMDAGVRGEIERYLHLVQRECSRCGHIVQNLLVFARRGDAQYVPTDVNEIVERSIMLIRHHLEITGIQLRTELLAGDASIVADQDQLQQALVALLVNAVEAMSKGGQLSVRVNGSYDAVTIAVSDTGAGIEKDVLPQIFEPFFSTKNNESGSGLGLAVVYGIVHHHNGTIDVDSTPGEGTTFCMTLPRNHEGTVQYASQTAASARS